VAYLVFIAENLCTLLPFSKNTVILLLIPFQTLLSWVSNQLLNPGFMGVFAQAVDWSVILSQSGFCVAYLVTIAANVSSVTRGLSNGAVVATIIPFQILLSWVSGCEYRGASIVSLTQCFFLVADVSLVMG
jgi:hypothetical protein